MRTLGIAGSHRSRSVRSSAPSMLVVALVLVGLIVATPQPRAHAAVGSVTTAPVTATSECQDVVFIGARGSDQKLNSAWGMGPEVKNAFDSFVLEAVAQGEQLRIGYYALPYPALPVSALVDLSRAVPKISSDSRYWTSIDIGVIQTLGLMNQRSSRCSETYVLAGFSQGAIVMHRALLSLYHGTGIAARINGDDRILKRISAVLAIGDGDRIGAQGGAHYGTASTRNDSWGIVWGLNGQPIPPSTAGDYPPFKEALPDDGRSRATSFIDVCMAGDIVCDFPRGSSNPWRGMAIHTSSYKSDRYVRQAAESAYQLDVDKRAEPEPDEPDAAPLRPWTVGPLTVSLNDDWGPVASADPSNGYSADLTNQAPCTNCQAVPAPLVSASVGLWTYGAWCTGTVESCSTASGIGQRTGDAPAVTVGGRTPDYSGRAEMSGYAGTELFWCFSAEKTCIRYRRATDSPQIEASPALLALLNSGTWAG